MPVGTEATLTVDRASKKMDFKLKIADRGVRRTTWLAVALEAPERSTDLGQQAKFGISIRNLSDPEKEDLPNESRRASW